ncbi:MAG: ankyrin repeat domain-containing protein [Planctomycetes bacterium]|nr:ankyrin repeat domain-containing protein [Planctomycetota bacterium]
MSESNIHDQVRHHFCNDDAAGIREALTKFPALKSLINEPTGDFNSPPIVNVRSREMLDVLLDAGADINAKSRWWAGGFGLLHSAPPDLAAYAIERGATVDIHAAARLGLFDKLRELISADPASVHARGGDGQTPLHFASTIEIAEYLLDHGAAIDALDVDHVSTPAQYMVRDRPAIARFLVARGCKTDLLMAAALGDIERAKKLLDADPASIRLRVSDEYFPLIGGQNGGQCGGTIYQWTLGWYVSAHQVAREFGHDEMFKLLMDRSPSEVKLITACWLGDEAAVASLIAAEPDLVEQMRDEDRRQIAHAARNNNLPSVGLMSQIGLPVNTTSQHLATPLHWAAFHGNAEMAELLLARNPPLEVKDADFQGTPLGWAIHGSENGCNRTTGNYSKTVESLLRAGAKAPAEICGTEEVRHVLLRQDHK